jgi:hypothetical protein
MSYQIATSETGLYVTEQKETERHLRVANDHINRLRKAMTHVVNELEEDFDTDDGKPNKAMKLANELNEAMYGPGGF